MSEPEKVEPATNATETPTATPPEQAAVTPDATPAAPVAAAPAPAAKPHDKKKPGGGGGGGGGGTPRKRTRESGFTAEEQARFQGPGPRLKDLDAEIEAELEQALGGLSDTDLRGADTSRSVRKQQTGTPAKQEGTVIAIHGKDVFIDVPGGRSQGVLPSEQFPDGPPALGTKVEISIEGYDGANGLLLLTRKGAAIHADWSTLAEGMIVEARVIETNKGGLTVDVNGIRGFMPVSQIDLYRVEQPEQFINQRLLCVITDADPHEKNLVVSRRGLLEKQREEQREKLWAELAEGQIREGIVRKVLDFGAFVDIGGADGLLPVGEMSWQRVRDPNTIVQPGQSIKVVVLRLDPEARKISLGLRQLLGNPWDDIQDKYPTGTIITGTVTRVADFGAFVELEPGIEGLAHISELARQKVWRVKDVVQEGQQVNVRVLTVDAAQRRISLSVRQAIAEPIKTTEDEADDETTDEPVKSRPRPTDLRGGLGSPKWQIPPRPDRPE